MSHAIILAKRAHITMQSMPHGGLAAVAFWHQGS